MSEISIVKLSGLEYYERLNAEFYSPSFAEIYKVINRLKEKYNVEKLIDLIIN